MRSCFLTFVFLAVFAAWPFLIASLLREAPRVTPDREKVYHSLVYAASSAYLLAFLVVATAVHALFSKPKDPSE